MGNYLLCKRPLSETPFHIEIVHLNIWSMEELCYFLSENLALADEVVSDPALSVWLSQECGLEEKIREFDALSGTDGRISDRVAWLFVKSHYFSEPQFRVLKLRMEELDGMPPAVRRKAKADALLKNGKYTRCIGCYERVFREEGIDEQPAHFKAVVYNNMGCAYARLFQGARAADCFRKAYEQEDAAVFLEAALKAVYLEGGADKLKEAAKEQKVSAEVTDRIRQDIDSVKGKPLPADPQEALKSWIQTYHLSVDQ